jgi:hypothetical protein
MDEPRRSARDHETGQASIELVALLPALAILALLGWQVVAAAHEWTLVQSAARSAARAQEVGAPAREAAVRVVGPLRARGITVAAAADRAGDTRVTVRLPGIRRAPWSVRPELVGRHGNGGGHPVSRGPLAVMAGPCPRGRRGGRSGDPRSGQAALELLATVPVVVLAALAAWQFAAVIAAGIDASGRARAAAMERSAGSGLVRIDEQVAVPVVLPGVRGLTLRARAAVRFP